MAGFSIPIFQFLLLNGLPNASGKIFVYQTGTTTTVNIYADNNLITPLANPLTLDSNGEAKFYVANTINLRIDSYDVNNGFIQSIDPVFPVGSTSNIIGTVVYKSTSFNLTAANIGQNIIATAAITVNLPLTNTFNNYSEVTFNANGGTITLMPQSGEKFIGQANGATKTIPQGSSAALWTDSLGNWGLNFLYVVPAAPIVAAPITNSLNANVLLNNTANYFDGPSVAQGSTGTWFASGNVTFYDTGGSDIFQIKLWDGTTVIASCDMINIAANEQTCVHLSGFIVSPAGNLRISVRDIGSTNGVLLFNTSGNSKDCTITAFRIA